MRVFDAGAMVDDHLFWVSEDMKLKYGNRWHVQSLVVSSEYQRRGLGRMLMSEVLQRAQDEGVVVGLEASPDGEKLYRSLGFELRGRFCFNCADEEGGIMMWSPKVLR
jgi:ribosomal protein S18 acetylase RimI-like enzyme